MKLPVVMSADFRSRSDFNQLEKGADINPPKDPKVMYADINLAQGYSRCRVP
jgi:hypothetical protein